MKNVEVYCMTLNHYIVDEKGQYHMMERPLIANMFFNGEHCTDKAAMLSVDLDMLYDKIKDAVMEGVSG